MNQHPIYRSGSVTRWHSNPDVPAQTLADHHGRVAQIVAFFWPDKPHLLYSALHHDCGELMVGDVSSPAKEANPKLKAVLEEAEAEARKEMGLKPFAASYPALRFADRLEAYCYVSLHAPRVLGQDEWFKAADDLWEMAYDLGVEDKLVRWWNLSP
jgi:5'-deoxynucleotidase YfbR-like HD superfamily hydrolase